jgi:hypothetical protein
MSAVVARQKVATHLAEKLHDLYEGAQRHTLSPEWRGRLNWRVETHCITALTPISWID